MCKLSIRNTIILTLTCFNLLLFPCWGKMASIRKDNVNVRSGPSLKKSVIFQAHVGYPIEIKKKKGDWVFIKDWMSDTGWVYKPLVSHIKTAVILKDNVNMRRGPGINHRVVKKASEGQVYKIFGRKKNWIKLGYYLDNEVIGWVRQDLVWGD